MLDVATELIFLCLPLWFISKNQIKLSKKRQVVFVFSFRLAVAAFSIVYMVSYVSYLNGHGNTQGIAVSVAWQEILLGFSLLSASIPCLRSFLWAFQSNQLQTTLGGSTNEETSTPKSSPGPWQNQMSLRPSNLARMQQPSRASEPRLRPDKTEYKCDVQTQNRHPSKTTTSASKSTERPSTESFDSECFVIHQTRDVEVRRSTHPWAKH